MAGLRTELWEKEFIKDFYPNSTFLKEAEDKSSAVDNEKLNLAESGANPEVLLDNTTFPIPIVEQGDVAKEVLLRTMSTKNTVIRSITQAARKQNLRADAMAAHKRNMALEHMKIAAHSFALTTASAGLGNVVVEATGADRGDGFKAVTFNDIFTVGEVYDEFDIPNEYRNLSLDIKHLNDLRREDLKEFKDLIAEINEGKMSSKFGIKIHKYSQNPFYTLATNAKIAYGATPTAAEGRASIGFVKTEVLRAFGTTKMWLRENDPEAEGDIFHFSNRFIAIPKRDKLRVALLSKSA